MLGWTCHPLGICPQQLCHLLLCPALLFSLTLRISAHWPSLFFIVSPESSHVFLVFWPRKVYRYRRCSQGDSHTCIFCLFQSWIAAFCLLETSVMAPSLVVLGYSTQLEWVSQKVGKDKLFFLEFPFSHRFKGLEDLGWECLPGDEGAVLLTGSVKLLCWSSEWLVTDPLFRRRRRSTCYLWITWNCEMLRRGSCPASTSLLSSTLNRGTPAFQQARLLKLGTGFM